MPSIRFDSLAKTYDNGYRALNGISFTIEEGEFFVLVGPSGCGKSTLLRSVAGLESVQGGSIFFDDIDITNTEPKSRNIGMVFQNYALYPHLTVFENIAFPLEIQKKNKSEIQNAVLTVATQVSLQNLLDRKPKELSGGQRQRVALARAIVKNPSLFLFDEPLSNLDAHLRGQMRMEILSMHQRYKKTSIYVTHDQIEAMTMATRIAVMKEGNIIQIGTPSELYLNPQSYFVATFIGSPTINTFEGKFVERDGEFLFQDSGSGINFQIDKIPSFASSHQTILCCFRPECCTISPTSIEEGAFRFASIEYVGNESLGIFLCGERRITVRLPANFSQDLSQWYTLQSIDNQFFCFDSTTEARIYE